MSIICRFFGHAFHIDEGDVLPTWSRIVMAYRPASEWYRTIRVTKECGRCGHMHSNTFRVPSEWPAPPNNAPRR